METYAECYPCLIEQTIRAARKAGADPQEQKAFVQQALPVLGDVDQTDSPVAVAEKLHGLVWEKMGDADVFREEKKRSTEQALALYPQLRRRIKESEDPFETAVRLSIAGNIIDLGTKDTHADLEKTIARSLREPLAVDHLSQLRERIKRVEEILYLGDNAGETVFDRLLIEVLPVPVTYAVRGGPIFNDAVQEDAHAAGVDQVADRIISNGSRAPGTVLGSCSSSFRSHFRRAPLVIAKGQGNFETVGDAGEKVFCLFQVKCPVIGRDLEVPVGSLIVRQGG